MVIISAIVCVYYNVIIAWTLYYFVKSFAWELPWSHCKNPWNTERCFTRWNGNDSLLDNETVVSTVATTVLGATTSGLNGFRGKARTSSEEFWEYVSRL